MRGPAEILKGVREANVAFLWWPGCWLRELRVGGAALVVGGRLSFHLLETVFKLSEVLGQDLFRLCCPFFDHLGILIGGGPVVAVVLGANELYGFIEAGS